MSKNGLLSTFTDSDFRGMIAGERYDLSDIVSLSYVTNKSTGERMARAVLSDGVTLIKHVGPRGTGDKIDHVIPSYRNIASRNAVILDLAADPDLTQEMIAAMMDISQSTVSNVLRNS